ncbi:hypothetical protein RBH26_06225 [Natronolimnohabitans sp. A-GB9]|uniref:hypothetical protein n=1 Tax=Natronolimnohabitans sp. A-GB9 TaxID=3069757 RepID=UPI0027B7B665|nr:hypothetical protein [Natronolimnohabitans sp. A-GB9]MDQ2050077.1 hypothetical protein [Natronolimnohabitans sp. A-GB9]
MKPLAPYLEWVRRYTEAGDRIVVPCAGTAPAAIAAEREYGDRANVPVGQQSTTRRSRIRGVSAGRPQSRDRSSNRAVKQHLTEPTRVSGSDEPRPTASFALRHPVPV